MKGAVLTGSLVRLEPLTHEHVPGLFDAAVEDRLTYGYTLVPSTPRTMRAYVEAALAEADRVPYAVVRLSDGAVVGSTSFLSLEYWALPYDEAERTVPGACEIGATWYAASAQRTGINTECKLLLLRHAFETWGVVRVSLQTDARNARSRAAIERIGASFEGIRRAHKRAADGSVRDSAFYSITWTEWPDVEQALIQRLERRV